MDWGLIVVFVVGAVTSSALWTMVMRAARDEKERLVYALGYANILVAMLSIAVWVLLTGWDPLHLGRYLAAYFLGMTVRVEVPARRDTRRDVTTRQSEQGHDKQGTEGA